MTWQPTAASDADAAHPSPPHFTSYACTYILTHSHMCTHLHTHTCITHIPTSARAHTHTSAILNGHTYARTVLHTPIRCADCSRRARWAWRAATEVGLSSAATLSWKAAHTTTKRGGVRRRMGGEGSYFLDKGEGGCENGGRGGASYVHPVERAALPLPVPPGPHSLLGGQTVCERAIITYYFFLKTLHGEV